MHSSLLKTNLWQFQVCIISTYVIDNTINRLTQINLSYTLYVGIIMQKYKCISYTCTPVLFILQLIISTAFAWMLLKCNAISNGNHHCKTHIKDKLVTRLWQGHNKVVYNEQGGGKVVTRWWQDCDSIVYNAHDSDKVMTRLFPASKLVTRLSQPCDKFVQHTHNLVKNKLKPTIKTDICHIYKVKTLHSRWSSEVKLVFKMNVLPYM